MIDKMEELTKRIAVLPGTRAELTTFPSGAALLDVWRGGRLFVMACAPAWKGLGVAEVHDGEGFQEKYDFFSEEYAPAAEYLWRLVQEALPVSVEEANQAGGNGQPATLQAGPQVETSREQP